MNIRELVSMLSAMDGDAEVYLGVRRNYPWQCTLAGVVARREFEAGSCRGGCAAERRANEVFLLEGEQVAHLSRHAWRGR